MNFYNKLFELKFFIWMDKVPVPSYDADSRIAEDFLKIQIPFQNSKDLEFILRKFTSLAPITNGYQLLTNGTTYIESLPNYEQPECLWSLGNELSVPYHTKGICCYLWANKSFIELLIFENKTKRINEDCIEFAFEVEKWLEKLELHLKIDLGLKEKSKLKKN